MTTWLTMKIILAIALCFTPTLASADWCQWEEIEGQLQFVCYPEYEVTMHQQPNWTLYNVGDVVWVMNELQDPLSIANPAPTAWHVFDCEGGFCANQSAGYSPSAAVPHGPYIVREGGYISRASCFPYDNYASVASYSDQSWIERLLVRCGDNLEIYSCSRTVHGGGLASQHPEVFPCP